MNTIRLNRIVLHTYFAKASIVSGQVSIAILHFCCLCSCCSCCFCYSSSGHHSGCSPEARGSSLAGGGSLLCCCMSVVVGVGAVVVVVVAGACSGSERVGC